MGLSTNIVRRRARYYVRLRVPQDLIPSYGRKEIWKSLGTADAEEARRLAPMVIHRLREDFETRRRNFKRRQPSETDLIRLAQDFYVSEVQHDRQQRLTGAADNRRALNLYRDSRPGYEAAIRQHLADGETALIEWAADDIVRRENLDLPHESLGYASLCHHLLRAELEALKRAKERDDGRFDGKPTDPILLTHAQPASVPAQPSTAAERAKTPDGLKTLPELLEMMHKTKQLAEQTKRDHETAIRMFTEFAGDKRVCEITKHDLITYADFLLTVPTNRASRREFQGMNIIEAAGKNQELSTPYPTIRARTINGKWLAHVKALITYAFDRDAIPDNPSFRVRLNTGKSKRIQKRRHPFTQEQLKKIFADKTFTGSNITKNANFWGPPDCALHRCTSARNWAVGMLRHRKDQWQLVHQVHRPGRRR